MFTCYLSIQQHNSNTLLTVMHSAANHFLSLVTTFGCAIIQTKLMKKEFVNERFKFNRNMAVRFAWSDANASTLVPILRRIHRLTSLTNENTLLWFSITFFCYEKFCRIFGRKPRTLGLAFAANPFPWTFSFVFQLLLRVTAPWSVWKRCSIETKCTFPTEQWI